MLVNSFHHPRFHYASRMRTMYISFEPIVLMFYAKKLNLVLKTK